MFNILATLLIIVAIIGVVFVIIPSLLQEISKWNLSKNKLRLLAGTVSFTMLVSSVVVNQFGKEVFAKEAGYSSYEEYRTATSNQAVEKNTIRCTAEENHDAPDIANRRGC